MMGGRSGNPSVPAPVRLHALLHDAHEAVTGDIPTPWKREGNREDQDRLDARIYAKLDVPFPSAAFRQIVKECDRRALIVEADVLGPREFFEAEPALHAARAEALTPERVYIVRCLQEWNPPSATIEDRGALVTAYEALVERLVIACSR